MGFFIEFRMSVDAKMGEMFENKELNSSNNTWSVTLQSKNKKKVKIQKC